MVRVTGTLCRPISVSVFGFKSFGFGANTRPPSTISNDMALQSSVLMRSSLRALVSSTPTVSRSYLPYSSLTSVTRYASSISDNLASTSTAPPSSSTTPLLPNQPQVIEPTLLTHQQSPPRPPARPTRAAPRIKASKSALTLVRL